MTEKAALGTCQSRAETRNDPTYAVKLADLSSDLTRHLGGERVVDIVYGGGGGISLTVAVGDEVHGLCI
jgi:hypothetical protein